MPIRKIVFVHGIGDQTGPEFADPWKEEVLRNFPQLAGTCEFHGLYWEDLRKEAADRYPLIERNFASVLSQFKRDELRALLDNEAYNLVNSYIMDVLVYVGLPDMTLHFQNGCFTRLRKLTEGHEAETLIIAHSLGAAMMPQVTWMVRQHTGSIPYHSLLLLASPLGFRSPIQWAISDFVEVMGRLSGTDRGKTLRAFAAAWTGPRRIQFFRNANDIVCSDVQFSLLGGKRDIIPVQQGFDAQDIKKLTEGKAGCHHEVTFGKADVLSIGKNHDPVTYMQQPQFRSALQDLLNQ